MFDVEFKDFIKLYKSYTKETFLFVVNNINLSSYIPLRLPKKYYKFNFGKKMKTIDSKIKQKTSQHANQTNSQDFRFIIQKYWKRWISDCLMLYQKKKNAKKAPTVKKL